MLVYGIYITYVTYSLDKSFCDTRALVFLVPCYVHKKFLKNKNRMPYIYIQFKVVYLFLQKHNA